jgi:hypothetical protein
MHFEIDQSGRIEETQRDTVIAIANRRIQVSIRVPRKVKRKLKLIYRKQNRPKIFAVRTFASSIALLIRKSKIKPTRLIVDIEYPGYERIISEIIKEILRNNFSVQFKNIGKSSPAHIKAYYTYKKKLKEDYIATYKDLFTLAIKK